jgi:hypothetical protein
MHAGMFEWMPVVSMGSRHSHHAGMAVSLPTVPLAWYGRVVRMIPGSKGLFRL